MIITVSSSAVISRRVLDTLITLPVCPSFFSIRAIPLEARAIPFRVNRMAIHEISVSKRRKIFSHYEEGNYGCYDNDAFNEGTKGAVALATEKRVEG